MLRPDARIIEAGRDRMPVHDLPVGVLQKIGAVAMQNAGCASTHRGAMLDAIEAAAAGLDADDLYAAVVEERVKKADGVRAAADGGDDGVRQPAFLFEDLGARLNADHRLEVAHQ